MLGANAVDGSLFGPALNLLTKANKGNCDVIYKFYHHQLIGIWQRDLVVTVDPKDSFCTIGILIGDQNITTWPSNTNLWIKVGGERPSMRLLQLIKSPLIHMNKRHDYNEFVRIHIYCPNEMEKRNHINYWSKTKGYHVDFPVKDNSLCLDLLVNRPFKAMKV